MEDIHRLVYDTCYYIHQGIEAYSGKTATIGEVIAFSILAFRHILDGVRSQKEREEEEEAATD